VTPHVGCADGNAPDSPVEKLLTQLEVLGSALPLLFAEDAAAFAITYRAALCAVHVAGRSKVYETAVRCRLPCIPDEPHAAAETVVPNAGNAAAEMVPNWEALYRSYARRLPLQRLAVKQQSLADRLRDASSADTLAALSQELELHSTRWNYFAARTRRQMMQQIVALGLDEGELVADTWSVLDAEFFSAPRAPGNPFASNWGRILIRAHERAGIHSRRCSLTHGSTREDFENWCRCLKSKLEQPERFVYTLLDLTYGASKRLPELLRRHAAYRELEARTALGEVAVPPAGAHWCVQTMRPLELHGGSVRYSRKGGGQQQWTVRGVMVSPRIFSLLHWSIEWWHAGDAAVSEGAIFTARISASDENIVSKTLRWHYPRGSDKTPDLLLFFDVVVGFEQAYRSEIAAFSAAVDAFLAAVDPGWDHALGQLDNTVQAMKDVFLDALPESVRDRGGSILGAPEED